MLGFQHAIGCENSQYGRPPPLRFLQSTTNRSLIGPKYAGVGAIAYQALLPALYQAVKCEVGSLLSRRSGTV